MQPFTTLTGRAVPLLEDDIDTDTLYPARYLLVTDREGLGRYLFHDRRGDDFVLDRPAFVGASILIAGVNFGCGSSREQAVWALAGAGLRCVIAPSFGDIFYTNCFRNGLLPVTLPSDIVETLAAVAVVGASFVVDLTAQTIVVQGGPTVGFSINPRRRNALTLGLDEIDEILLDVKEVDRFEQEHRRLQPWLFQGQIPSSFQSSRSVP